MSDDVFVVLGNEVSAAAVEAGLLEHPAVAEAAVIGVPDPFVGFVAKGFVRLRPDAHATAKELVAFCKQRMPRHMYPRQVEILDQLPHTSLGEVDRVALGNQELARMRGQRPQPPR
jgi:acyl-coenzyme A synthetase/AMP-(fatty) acid ligase